MAESTWPPSSPRAALLSSPDGRKKYQQHQDRRNRSLSPNKRSSTLPDLQRASRKLLDDDEDSNEVDDSEDDEETLELKLAAIEAKLKLKKLQQSRGKARAEGLLKDREPSRRSPSRTSSTSIPKSSHSLDPPAAGMLRYRSHQRGEQSPRVSNDRQAEFCLGSIKV